MPKQRPATLILMTVERAIPILPTNDLAAAKVFYVDGLGFRVTSEASADGHRGLLSLQRGTIELTLDCPMDGHGRNACVSLRVTDVDAYYQEWSATVNPLRPPKNEEWGARTFDLLDPSGNTGHLRLCAHPHQVAVHLHSHSECEMSEVTPRSKRSRIARTATTIEDLACRRLWRRHWQGLSARPTPETPARSA